MHEIQVDFEVFKELTARLEFESQTHNDIVRDLLDLDAIAEETGPEPAMAAALNRISQATGAFGRPSEQGFYSRGLFLPEGTRMSARYKGSKFRASISDSRWIDEDGQEHSSPSAAATAITGNNVNGLRFWQAKRPNDGSWRRLEFIRNRAAHSHG